ncbi:GroEL-like equatorial domain [Phytophthora cinnamomi]|uniref:GroEL-like equatorial domain n=1 Tax=Phytophthora cinnamomi TaxID=4785 RepID=UPI003559D41B|nr:GroEL-like equatorial domain [Phytophthora cinnamomi]
MMSFTTELERTAGDLAALCRRSFGPCGEETLLFRPPDAPVVTGEGHAVLAAWKRGTEARDPLATFLLNAADGVHKQLGDASSEFILLVDAAVRHAAEGLRREQDARRDADRARLSREFSELKWELQRGMHKVSGLQLAVPVEANCDTMQPSEKFRETSANVLRSALTGHGQL